MKIPHLLPLLLATATSIKACGSCNGKKDQYSQYSYDNVGYPTYIPSNAPVNQAGYTPSGGYYDTHLIPEPTYTVYPESKSYSHELYPSTSAYAPSPPYGEKSYPISSPYPTAGNTYIPYAPEPTPIGIPPTPGYNSMSTSIAYVYPKINSTYTTGTSTAYFTTSKYASSSMHSSSTSVTVPIQTSSASNTSRITMISWVWAVAIGGVGVGLGMQIQF